MSFGQKTREKNRSSYLRFDQNEIDKEHYEIMLDIFIGEPLTARALCQTYTFSERTVIGFAIGRVE